MSLWVIRVIARNDEVRLTPIADITIRSLRLTLGDGDNEF
jgi:hypothetical protein